MELSNEFDVRAPIEQAWAVLTDLEIIAPCLPGAQLQEVEGDEYRGIVKIKVGPITAQYKGSAKFVSKDDVEHRAMLSASGRDTRGQGNASASITAELVAHGDITHVSVLTDLTITGKVAQFGRGVIGDVSAKLLDQFVENLETTVLAGSEVAALADVAAPAADSLSSSTVQQQAAETTQMLASELKKIWADDDADEPEGDDPVRIEREALPPRPDLLVPPAARDDAVRRIDGPEAEPIDLLDTAGNSVVKRLVPAVVVLVVVALVIAVVRRRRP